MLSSAHSSWDINYPLCTYCSIFIIVLVAWQIRRNYQGLVLEPKASCCQRHRKVRQRARDAASRARRRCREEAEKPWELLSIMKSQSWLPKEGNVRQLLCVDPCCQICDAATLEIQQLLQSERSQVSPSLLGLPQGSSGLEMVSISSVSLEHNLELRSEHSTDFTLAPVTQTFTQQSGRLTQSTDAADVQRCWTDHFQVGEDFPLVDVPMVSETVTSLRLDESVGLVSREERMHSNLNYAQQFQDRLSLNAQIPFHILNPGMTHVTHPMALPIVSTAQPFLTPDVLRLLELHVRKLIHFQRWGLPRRVEESLQQLVPNPSMCYQPENSQGVSFSLINTSQDCVHRFGTISHQTWYSYTYSQPSQTFWVSEWSDVDPEQRTHCEQASLVEKPLVAPDPEVPQGLCLQPEGPANDFRSNLQKEFTQLFCGLPSMHCESLVTSFLDTQGASKDTSKPSHKDTRLLKEFSPFSLLPQTPHRAIPPSSSTSPHESLYEHQEAQINVPFLTLGECKTLEWHLLQRQLQLQWGLSAVIPRSSYVQSDIQYKLCNRAKPYETLKAFYPRKSFSVLTGDLFFVPEHVRRLLELHLQKQLIHLRWGLPQKIQHSIQLLLPSTDQQLLPYRGRVLPNVIIPRPGDPEADGSADLFSPAAAKGLVPMPHLFVQAKAMLKSHIDSKCGQILQGKVPDSVQSSRTCRIPRSLAAAASFPNTPQAQALEQQAESNADLHHKLVPSKPPAPDQEKQAISGALIEHCRRPQTLSEETIKKLETTLRHKYLAFLSGLPNLYCVALSRATSPAVTSYLKTTEMRPGPVSSLQEALTQTTSLEGPLESCTQDDDVASADMSEEVQPEGEVEGRTEKVPLDSPTLSDSPNSLNTEILAKLNFHLKLKVLAMQFGISGKEKEYKDLAAGNLETESLQEALGSLSIPESTVLQKPPISCDSPPASDADMVHLKMQRATAVQAVCHQQKQPGSKIVPHGSAQWGSNISQFTMNMIEAHSVQMGISEESPNLEEPFSTEPQSPGKTMFSDHAPTLTEKNEEPGNPKAIEDLGGGDAALGLSPTSGNTHHDGDQEPEKRPLPRTPQGSPQQAHSFHLKDPCLPSTQDPLELEFPDPPPEAFVEKDSEHDMQDSQAKVNAIPEPARSAEVTRPVVSVASQSRPSPRPEMQQKPCQGQTWRGHISPGQVMPASPYPRPSPPEAGLRSRMKSFLNSFNPKTKGKTEMEPTGSTAGKVAKTSKGNVGKGLPPAKSPTKKTKAESSRGPWAQSVPSEKSVIGSLLTAPHLLDSKPRTRYGQPGSVSGPGQPRHCPRHCPRLSCATQRGSPP